MTPINLLDYARHSQKIPAGFLKHKTKQREIFSTWRIFGAHAWDFSVVTMLTIVMASVYISAAKGLVLTFPLKLALNKVTLNNLASLVFPLTTLSYFFFSYFFNEGQTLGMKVFKGRIHMPAKSMRSSLRWSLYSAALLFTCGLIYPFTKSWLMESNWGKFEKHDHLYTNLMAEQVQYPIDLLHEIGQMAKPQEEEVYDIAA